MAYAAYLALFLSSIGVVLIWLTFRETRAQSGDFKLSLNEANRSATAMEGVAESMARNVEHVVKSVEIMSDNADVQREFGMMNMRAYIDILIGDAVYQTDHTVFEAAPYMTNSGNTPARKVRWKIAADVLPVPLPDDFAFPLGDESIGENTIGSLKGGSFSATIKRRVPDSEVAAIKAGDGQALYCWGVVSYIDMFKKRRRTEFAQMLYWVPSGERREDGSRPEQVKGYHLERHSRTT